MKKWQKITGLIALSLIAIYELLTWANTYVYLKYVVEPTDNDLLIEQSYIYIDALSFGMWMNLALAVFLFIYLWRKSMTKTCSSPIKTISDEKTTIPFTFERAYCRIGVATDNSGIERMKSILSETTKRQSVIEIVLSIKLSLMTQSLINTIILK